MLFRSDREKMLWLGLVESASLFIGGTVAAYADSVVWSNIWAAGAVAVTIILCFCLRHSTPDSKIEFAPIEHQCKNAEGEATREV